jgi:hypothetical protein
VHLHCTIFETCYFVLSVDYAYLLSTFKHYDGTDFPSWSKDVLGILKILDLDYALRDDKPVAPIIEYEDLAKKMREYVSSLEKWQRSGYFAKMVIKHSIIDVLRGAFPVQGDGFILSAKELLISN